MSRSSVKKVHEPLRIEKERLNDSMRTLYQCAKTMPRNPEREHCIQQLVKVQRDRKRIQRLLDNKRTSKHRYEK